MSSEAPVSAINARAGKYLSFMLANEVYGVEISHVREIIALVPITAVPRTPAFIEGVINLRGKIIPVVNLRNKFEMAHREYTRESCIVVAEVNASGSPIWIGVLVDAVCEVFNVTATELEEVPSFGVRIDTSFLLGMAGRRTGVKLLLDIEKVLSHEELTATKTTRDQAQHDSNQTVVDAREQK